jgi:hypothetical protein
LPEPQLPVPSTVLHQLRPRHGEGFDIPVRSSSPPAPPASKSDSKLVKGFMGQFIRKHYLGVQHEDTRAALIVIKRRLIREGRAVRGIRDLPARFFTECGLLGAWIEPLIGATGNILNCY